MLKDTANLRKIDDFSEAHQISYLSHLSERRQIILDGNTSTLMKLSAELNGIMALHLPWEQTNHLLFCTDTVQGKATAEILKAKLQRFEVRSVEICVLNGMTTASQQDFARGIDSLLNICEERLIPLRDSGHNILFNLVGGFKSLQAYLQMLGMIYANEICYKFEAPDAPLLRIPRLPLQFDMIPLRKSAVLMSHLAAGAIVSALDVSSLPDVYVEIDGNDACLSVWGKFVWNSEKEKILSSSLLEHPGLKYESSFLKDYEKCQQPRERVAHQEAIAKASVLWMDGGLASLRKDTGLLYETYENRKGIGHFRVSKGLRISCIPEQGTLTLRHLGAHDYVNTNP